MLPGVMKKKGKRGKRKEKEGNFDTDLMFENLPEVLKKDASGC